MEVPAVGTNMGNKPLAMQMFLKTHHKCPDLGNLKARGHLSEATEPQRALLWLAWQSLFFLRSSMFPTPQEARLFGAL